MPVPAGQCPCGGGAPKAVAGRPAHRWICCCSYWRLRWQRILVVTSCDAVSHVALTVPLDSQAVLGCWPAEDRSAALWQAGARPDQKVQQPAPSSQEAQHFPDDPAAADTLPSIATPVAELQQLVALSVLTPSAEELEAPAHHEPSVPPCPDVPPNQPGAEGAAPAASPEISSPPDTTPDTQPYSAGAEATEPQRVLHTWRQQPEEHHSPPGPGPPPDELAGAPGSCTAQQPRPAAPASVLAAESRDAWPQSSSPSQALNAAHVSSAAPASEAGHCPSTQPQVHLPAACALVVEGAPSHACQQVWAAATPAATCNAAAGAPQPHSPAGLSWLVPAEHGVDAGARVLPSSPCS